MPKSIAAGFLVVALFLLASCASQATPQDAVSEQAVSNTTERAGLIRRDVPLTTEQPTSWVERYYERKPISIDDFHAMLAENKSLVKEGQMFALKGTIGAMFLHPATNDGEWTEIATAKEGSADEIYAITLLGSNGNAVGCLTDKAHASEVVYGEKDVVFEGRIEAVGIEMDSTLNREFYQLHPCNFPGRQARYPEDAQPEPIVISEDCTSDLKREAFSFAFTIDAFLQTWDEVVRQIDQGTTTTTDIARKFSERVDELQQGREKLSALSGNTCPSEAKELANLALELETTARDFQGFFQGEQMLARVAVQMAKFEKLSESLMGVFLRIQAL